ncbi:MAG: DNA polymerase IV [bacterium]
MAEDRHIVHIDLDSFFVSVERILDPSLIGKPVVVGGSSDRGVVSSCSYEARKYGVHSAMPARQAKKLCPHAIFVKGSMGEYGKYSKMVTDIIAERSPLMQKSSIDEFYIDISGMDKFFGCYKWTKELRQSIIKNTGLPISFGLSINKCVAKIATNQAKPNGELYVPKEKVKVFLAPLPVGKIPMLGKKMQESLSKIGIQTIGQLAALSESFLENKFGEYGGYAWRRANGIDNSPVRPYHERKSISTESTFYTDTNDILFLDRVLASMVSELTHRLRKENFITGNVAVKIRYENFETRTQQSVIEHTNADHLLLEKVRDIFEKSYNKNRMVRLIGVRFGNLVHGLGQVNLFENTSERQELYKAMDNIKNRFGKEFIQTATQLGGNKRKPNA